MFLRMPKTVTCQETYLSRDGKLGLDPISKVFRISIDGFNPGKSVRSVELSRVSLRYPSFAHEIDAMWRRMILEDGTMDAEINLERFCRYARLQSWTVKRAYRMS